MLPILNLLFTVPFQYDPTMQILVISLLVLPNFFFEYWLNINVFIDSILERNVFFKFIKSCWNFFLQNHRSIQLHPSITIRCNIYIKFFLHWNDINLKRHKNITFELHYNVFRIDDCFIFLSFYENKSRYSVS